MSIKRKLDSVAFIADPWPPMTNSAQRVRRVEACWWTCEKKRTCTVRSGRPANAKTNSPDIDEMAGAAAAAVEVRACEYRRHFDELPPAMRHSL